MPEHWYGLVDGHYHLTVDEMWRCRACLKVIRRINKGID